MITNALSTFKFTAVALLAAAFFVLAVPLDTHAANAEPEILGADNHKYNVIKEIYDNLVSARGGKRSEAPPLVVYGAKDSPGKVAHYIYVEGASWIEVGEGLYDVFESWSEEDRKSALAVILGHELAHHYENHRWGADFGFAFVELDVGKEVWRTDGSSAELFKLETEADFAGGILGYVAGYDTLDISPRVYEAVYTAFNLSDERLGNYPKKEERKGIAEGNIEDLKRLANVFETANRLMFIEEYDGAARLYDYIARSFPSREIYNNAGVARLLKAMKLSNPRFVYPVAFDSETRLIRPKRKVRTKGATQKKAERIRVLLETAKENFEEAMDKDPEYAMAVLNLATAYDLMGKHDQALGFAEDARDIAEKNGEPVMVANALIVRGIAYGNKDLLDEAREGFAEAAKESRALALATLNTEALLKSSKGFVPTSGEKPSMEEEGIGGLTIKLVFESLQPKAKDAPLKVGRGDEVASLSGIPGRSSNMKVSVKSGEGWNIFVVKDGAEEIYIIDTPEGYEGSSARGVKVGDDLAVVREKYGEPVRILSSSGSNHYVYRKSKVVFDIGGNGEVVGWMLYGKAK